MPRILVGRPLARPHPAVTVMRTLALLAALATGVSARPDKPFAPKGPPEPKLDTSFALADVNFGKPVVGTVPTAARLKGKVVVVEFWSVACPRCLAALPDAVVLEADLADFGLVAVAAHCVNAPAEQVKAAAKARGVTFAVTERASVPSDDIPELPHTVVFGPDGTCAFRGTPRDAEVAARKAVGAALVAGAGRERFGPRLAPIAAALAKGQSPHLAVPKVVAQLSGPEADDAKALAAALTAVGRERFERAKALAASDPAEARRRAEKLATAFKGTQLADEAAELVAKLRADQ